jgi:hypothetical protein
MLSDALTEVRLLTHHLAMLRVESGLPDDIIAERGYFSATKFAEVRRLGFSDGQSSVPGLVVPLWSVTGERPGYSYRPDTPRVGEDGKPKKYEQPRKSKPVLDVPPRSKPAMRDPSIPLYVTEGAKKADALAARGAAAINVSGVWSWRGTNEVGGKTVLPDWDEVALEDRLVRLVFDSDVVVKQSVALALLRVKCVRCGRMFERDVPAA